MTETPHPWDRLPTETAKNFAAFRAYATLGARQRSIAAAVKKTTKGVPSAAKLARWKSWSTKYHWVSRTLARAEWQARTADEAVQEGLHEVYLAIVTVAHEFLTSRDPEQVRIGSKMVRDHYPPVTRVADVSERIADMPPGISQDQIDRMKAIRDESDPDDVN